MHQLFFLYESYIFIKLLNLKYFLFLIIDLIKVNKTALLKNSNGVSKFSSKNIYYCVTIRRIIPQRAIYSYFLGKIKKNLQVGLTLNIIDLNSQ